MLTMLPLAAFGYRNIMELVFHNGVLKLVLEFFSYYAR